LLHPNGKPRNGGGPREKKSPKRTARRPSESVTPSKRKAKPVPPTDDAVRRLILEYLHERNRRATSVRGKRTGAAVTISVLRAELKKTHGLKAQQVVGNLTYLISQGWVEEKPLAKSWTTPKGGVVPAVTPYYGISAAGIDKIGGPSEFMRDRFQGIKIEATGQNIITLGDGNQVNVRFRDVGEALADLRQAIKASGVDEATKLEVVADIDSIQDQLAKSQPNKTVVATLWAAVEKVAVAAGLADAAVTLAPMLQAIIK